MSSFLCDFAQGQGHLCTYKNDPTYPIKWILSHTGHISLDEGTVTRGHASIVTQPNTRRGDFALLLSPPIDVTMATCLRVNFSLLGNVIFQVILYSQEFGRQSRVLHKSHVEYGRKANLTTTIYIQPGNYSLGFLVTLLDVERSGAWIHSIIASTDCIVDNADSEVDYTMTTNIDNSSYSQIPGRSL